jgi:polyferredoxin
MSGACKDRTRGGPGTLRRLASPAAASLATLLLLLLGARAARGDLGMQSSRLPLWKAFDQPFFSLDGSHVELFALLFLFMMTALVMSVRRRRQAVRHLVQIVSLLVFFYVVFSCLGVFGMIRNTIHGISLIGTVYTESFFWMSLPITIIAFSLTTGPFFCGWICPTGTIQELFTMGRELVTRRRPVRATPVTLGLMGLFFALFLYLVFSFSHDRQLFVEDSSLYWAASILVLVFLVLTRVIDDVPTRSLRWVSFLSILTSAIFKTVITSPVHFAFVDVIDPASAVTTLILSLASIFVGRAWCRYLCPWGQLMSLVHRFSRLRIVLAPSCTSCGTCASSCRVGAIDLVPRRVRTEHCQLCFACVDVCPNGAVRVADVWAGGSPASEEVKS